MWSWLERLLQSLQGDTPAETEERQQRVPSSSKQPQTRTKNIYPRERERTRTKPAREAQLGGQFRFPVIPDNDKPAARPKNSVDIESPFEVYKQQKQSQVEITHKAKQHDAVSPQHIPSVSSSRKEQTFQPTQILSPIYGKIDPNKVERVSANQDQQAKQTSRAWAKGESEIAAASAEVVEETLLVSREAAVEEVSGEVLEEVLKKEQDEAPEDVLDGVLEVELDEAPEVEQDEVPEVEPEETPEDVPEEVPEDVPDEMPEVEPEEAPEDVPEEAPEVEPDEVPEVEPEETPEDVPEEVPEDVPDEIPEVEPEEAPEDVPDEMPEEGPEAAQVQGSNDGQKAVSYSWLQSIRHQVPNEYQFNHASDVSEAEVDAEKVDEIVWDRAEINGEKIAAELQPVVAPITDSPTYAQQSDAITSNGISSNGISSNGISSIGISSNEVVSNEVGSNTVYSNTYAQQPASTVITGEDRQHGQGGLHVHHGQDKQDRQVEPTEQPDENYEFPSLSLLDAPPVMSEDSYEYTLEQKRLLEETLENFHVNAQVVGIVKGPSVTRFELQPAPGVKVNKITGLIDDIKLNLAAKDIRIEAPIPGRNAVGIEVPNIKSEPIFLRRIIGSEKFQNHPSPLAIALGMDIGGEPIVADIKKMPHGLIAGATGSGKSVCINSIIVSLLYKATPEQVRLLLVDPKMVELAPYNHLPHLVTPVVTDAKQATAALKWAVEEMEKRYALFVEAGVRDIERYNKQASQELPYIVIIIDELADLMMVSPQDVEDCIIRIAQKARACGIHLLLATQRPSVDVITGNIKANVPTRLAFAVFSQIDSRTILDQSGAERLLGRGDMLFLESGATPIRLQGNYVSDDEIDRVTEMIKDQRKPAYFFSKEDLEQTMNAYEMGDDSLFHEALVFVAEQGQASASSLQRRFRVGYNRAARLIDMMEAAGYIAGQSGAKPRAVLITAEDAIALADGTTLL